jgi:dTDP-4-amino-4,6-dideoxygalactose transaminase
MTTVTLDRYKGRAFSYDVIAHGFNYRMDEIRSSLALVQLKRLDGFLQERGRIRERYRKNLTGSPILVPDFDWQAISQPGDSVGYHIMPVILPETRSRDAVAARLKEQGIQSSVHYRPVHTFTAYSDAMAPDKRPARTEAICERQLTLPMYPTMTNDQVDLVSRCLIEAVE